MSNRTVILKDREGNNIYPKIPYTNVFGVPHEIANDVTIFYGTTNVPSTDASVYEGIKVNDLFIPTKVYEYGVPAHDALLYKCQSFHTNPVTGVTTINWEAYGNIIIHAGDPPANLYDVYSYTRLTPVKGMFYLDISTWKLYVCTNNPATSCEWLCLNESELPESSSSDAGKVLTVDQNGDPGWENREPRYELLGTYDMSQYPTGFTFDATGNIDDFLIVCENILSTENGKRLSFRIPMDSVSIAPNTDYALSNVTPRNFYIKHERINENLYETVLCGDLLATTRNVQINNYSNTTSYSSKLKRVQVSVGTGTGSAIASGTIKIYGRIKF